MKEIEGFEGYFIDEFGNMFGNKKYFQNKNRELRKLKGGLDRKGYPIISLYTNGKRYQKKVHRLVAQAFIPNPENKETVNHINGIKTDNRVVNLEWCTQSENNQHAYDTGLQVGQKGIKNGASKLTEEQVLLIREDTRILGKIAMDYGVSNALICCIKKRKRWGHLK
jgi:methyl coenzyme M reductase gamma subunit